MIEVALRLILGGILAGAAVAKLASPSSSRAALATFGIRDRQAQAAAWATLIGAELALAAGVIAGVGGAAWAAAALMALFAATMAGAIVRGRSGAPCACFGARSTVGWPAVLRNVALAGGFAAIPFLPSAALSTEQWLGIAVGAALVGCLALGVAVLALAREVGMLRLRLGPGSALEIPEEGPELGSRSGVVGRFSPGSETEFCLAVFSSEGCPACASLRPAVSALASDPLLAVEVFDEVRHADVWADLDVPGSPFAVALDREGIVLAKGTFNNLAQLESVLGSAERRRAERPSEPRPQPSRAGIRV